MDEARLTDALDREAIRAELERLQSSNEQGNTQ